MDLYRIVLHYTSRYVLPCMSHHTNAIQLSFVMSPHLALDNKIFMILLSNFTVAFFTFLAHTHVVGNACKKSKEKLTNKIIKILAHVVSCWVAFVVAWRATSYYSYISFFLCTIYHEGKFCVEFKASLGSLAWLLHVKKRVICIL